MVRFEGRSKEDFCVCERFALSKPASSPVARPSKPQPQSPNRRFFTSLLSLDFQRLLSLLSSLSLLPSSICFPSSTSVLLKMQNYSNESSFLGASQDDVPIAEAIPMTTNGTNSRLSVMSGPNGTRGKTRELNRDQINDLVEQGYSQGLIKALSQNSHDFDFRFWIVDNSGSMQIGDGSRIVTSGKSDGSLKAVRATRWEELKDTVQYVVD